MEIKIFLAFRLAIEEPNCRGSMNHQILIPGDLIESENATNIHFYPNGYFRNESQIYAPDEYCIERFIKNLFKNWEKIFIDKLIDKLVHFNFQLFTIIICKLWRSAATAL